MKTPEKRYTVIRHYTRDDFVSLGYNRWINKNIAWMGVYLGALIGAGFIVDAFTPKNSIWNYLFIIPFVVVFFGGCYKAYQYGVKLFNEFKDLPEPIDLSAIKESK
jgi:hypothetical protein